MSSENKTFNTSVIAIVAVAVIAIGGLTYYTTKSKDSGAADMTTAAAVETASGDTQSASAEDTIGTEIKPGNPVVATVNGQEIKRLDVLSFIQTLPDQTRQAPIGQLFPVALNQVINNQVINQKTENVNLDRDEEVRKQLEVAKKNIVRGVYLQKKVNEQITDERLAEAYEQYKSNFPEINEVKARHILVQDKDTARDVIQKLNEGADFEQLAKEYSTDGTAEKGGLVGYFAENEVVKPFAEAAFALDIDEYSKIPVKSDFGYHVIQTLEKRKRPPAELSQIKPFLEAQLRNVLLGQMVQTWRSEADVQTFDINGDRVPQQASAETSAADQAADVAPAAGE